MIHDPHFTNKQHTYNIQVISRITEIYKKNAIPLNDVMFILAGVPGFEPGKCQIQSLVPYRLAIPQGA